MNSRIILFSFLSSAVIYANITGEVFVDLPINSNTNNQYGVKDSNELGIKNVIVKAFDTNNTEVASTTTDENGRYSLNTKAKQKYRIEFSNYPSYLKESMGAVNSSNSVQFAQDGDIVNYALQYPSDYTSTNNPDIASVVFVNGDTTGNHTTLAKFSYSSEGLSNDGINTNLTTLATNNQVGSTWGLAYAKKTKTLYSAAFLKRHVGLIGDANDNLGKIWKVDITNPSPSLFVTIPNTGTIGTNADRGITGGKGDPSHDNTAYEKVGKIGLGDLDISEDEKYLYTINLNDKKLYRVTIDSDNNPSTPPNASTDIKSYTIPNPGCNNGEWRPFALKVYHSSIYVGGVCSAENNGTRNDLKAYIYKFDGTTFSEVLNFPLNYDKVSLFEENKDANDQTSMWHPWVTNQNVSYWPQPMLTDIEFDVNGDMIIAFTDRYGHQAGHKNYQYKSNDVYNEVVAGGDILRACLDNSGSYTLENGGVCGNVTGAGHTHTHSGPGGGEFYNDRFSKNDPNNGHAETSDGAVALLAGSGELILNSMDPVDFKGSGSDQDYFRSGGPAWYYNSGTNAGSKRKGFQLYIDKDYNAVGFAKGTGVGDIELLTEPAPIEIGNYVWYDSNKNGIQDANENAIDNVEVTLHEGTDCSANEVGSATTDQNGNYYFGGVNNVNMSGGNTLKYNTQYTICIALNQNVLVDKKATVANINSDKNDSIDSDGVEDNNGNIYKTLITGDAGENNHTYDFGFKDAKACLGNYVWYDSNANGIQDDGEKGVEGVKVYLLKSDGSIDTTKSATTDKNGKYEICDLDPGTYGVQFDLKTLPKGYVVSPQSKGGDNEKDSDANQSNGKTKTVTLNEGDEYIDFDMGIYKPICLGDFVWEDKNYNGLQDDGSSTGIEGIKVELLYKDGSPAKNNNNEQVVAQETNSSGRYEFCNLKPGIDYKIKFTPKAEDNLRITIEDANSNKQDSNDSDINSDDIIEVNNPLEDNLTLDAGYYKPACIGDYIWLDKNANGIQDAGESGISGVKVELFNSDGTKVKDANNSDVDANTTDSNGKYQFCNLLPGEYYVKVTSPNGYYISPKNNPNTNELKDSDIDLSTHKSAIVTIHSGDNNDTIDAGLYKAACIGDFVWEDMNANGIQDKTEPGISGAVVTILDKDGNSIKDVNGNNVNPITTDDDGIYHQCNLIPGEYKVKVVAPDGYYVTRKDAYGNSKDSNDSDIDPTFNAKEGTTEVTTLESGEDDRTWDAGLFKPACLGDYTFKDENANGIQDAGDAPLSGVEITLLDKDGNSNLKYINGDTISSKTTDNSGKYEFCNLVPGSYKVKFAKSPDANGPFVSTKANVNNNSLDKNDSDIPEFKDASNGLVTPETVTLRSGDNNKTIDAGFIQEICLGDKVWEDSNANGIQDQDEEPIANLKVNLFMKDDNGNWTTAKDVRGNDESSTETNSTGNYKFCHLKPAVDYKIVFDKPAKKDGLDYYVTSKDAKDNKADSNDSDIDNNRAVIVNAPTQDDYTLDAGFFRPACIGDYVWEDKNANGIQDKDEVSIKGVKVELFDENNNSVVDIDGKAVAYQDTNSSGKYHFCNLRPAKYHLKFTAPEGYYVTRVSKGNDKEKDSDMQERFNLKVGTTLNTELVSGEDDRSWDAGFFKSACIGNYAWIDNNTNGIQDENESGAKGVVLSLVDDNNNSVTDVNSNSVKDYVTGDDGKYEFCNLVPGEYQVKVTKLPDNYFLTINDATSDAKDSDVAVNNWHTSSGDMPKETLSSGENNTTFDVGIYKPACLGSKVWLDKNGNGIYDEGEKAIEGAEVSVLTKDENSYKLVKDIFNNDAKAVSDSNGDYKICNLLPGREYYVSFYKAPDSNGTPYITTKGNSGNEENDSDVESYQLNGGTTPTPIILDSGDNYPKLYAGFVQEVCIGDRVWYDKNLNGIQDEDFSKYGIKDITVHIYDANGSIAKDVYGHNINPLKTDNEGRYKFCHIKPGSDYKIKFDIPDSYHPTIRVDSNDSTKNSDNDNDKNPVITVKTDDLMKSVVPTTDNGISTIINPTYDLGIYCDCDDYKVHPQNYKKLSASAFNLVGGLMLILMVSILARKEID